MKNRQAHERKVTMRSSTLQRSALTLTAIGLAVLASACSSSGSSDPGSLGNPDPGNTSNNNNNAPGGGTQGAAADNGTSQATLDQRKVDYGEALRTASMKLVGSLPPLADIQAVAGGGKAVYEAKIDALLADPRFAAQQIQWWRDTLKTGQQGAPAQGMPSFDTAAIFAASVVVGDRPYTDLFTAANGTCPTFANNTFTPADCTNGAPTAGLLTDPGIMAQYYANMAFRRVRFVQETFVCSKFPTEFGSTPTPMGAGAYTSPWDFNSIAGGQTARINFQDTSAVICANCHTTMNHQAPLFAHFDDKGAYNATAFKVMTPSTGNPTSQLQDWLPAGQQFYWRNGGTPVADLPAYGKEIAKDPAVARCAVNRVWNWAMSRGDIVNDLAPVPDVVTDPYVAAFNEGGMKLKAVIRQVFTSDDYVKF